MAETPTTDRQTAGEPGRGPPPGAPPLAIRFLVSDSAEALTTTVFALFASKAPTFTELHAVITEALERYGERAERLKNRVSPACRPRGAGQDE